MSGMINLLPRSDAEVKQIQDALGDRWYAGVVLKDFATLDEAEERVRSWTGLGANISVGLGDGSAQEWRRALEIAIRVESVPHLNQPWLSSAYAHGLLKGLGRDMLVNCLIHPDPRGRGLTVAHDIPETIVSSLTPDQCVAILHGLGLKSIKLYPMRGQAGRGVLEALADAMSGQCAPSIIEPSGGLSPEDLDWVYSMGEEYGVVMIPHLYSSVRKSDGSLSDDALRIIKRHGTTI